MMIRLADLDVRWDFKNTDFVSLFSFEDETMSDPIISISGNVPFGECHGLQFVQTASDHVLKRSSTLVETLCADKDWTQANIYCDDYSDPHFTLPLAAVCSRFASFETVLLHGSLVEYNGNGVVFTGYSGIGKTTQAQLWEKYLGADIINGDKVFIRDFDEGVYAYGLPWKGSSPYCLNKKAPLKAVIVLRQAKENKIRRLTEMECMEYFMPHIFLPHWDEKCMYWALDTFDKILEKVPVWLLECRPDEEAVKLARDTVL